MAKKKEEKKRERDAELDVSIRNIVHERLDAWDIDVPWLGGCRNPAWSTLDKPKPSSQSHQV